MVSGWYSPKLVAVKWSIVSIFPNHRRAGIAAPLEHQVQVETSNLLIAAPEVVAQGTIGLVGLPDDHTAVIPDDVWRTRSLQRIDHLVEIIR